MTVTLPPRRPSRRPVDKAKEIRAYKLICPRCGGRFLATSTEARVRRLKCAKCGLTDKEPR